MKLRLLLIEDSLDDEALLLRLLKKADFQLDALRVEDTPALESALQEKWDLVISDYNLPRLDAMTALTLVRQAAGDVPFIIVSGVMGEETAVEAIKLGADDYVMKSNLARLPQTIRRELKDAQLRRERRSLEEQVRHSQKMEAMGQLAASVAHDFNNLLTVMMNFTQFAHDDLPAEHPSRADLREVVECGNRAAVLTRQLLAFGRKSVAEPQLTDLNAELTSCEKMLKRLLGPRIDYRTVPSQVPAWCVVDRGLIEQVLVNLVVNARDAMPDGGKLTVETALVEKHPTLQTPHVLLAITDTGVGMTDEVQKHIFEPFFTTKGPGRGTGLGLSTVAGIVKQCQGELSVYSAPGLGTTFKIYLPCAGEATLREAKALEAPVRGGGETVLLVEDQEPVRIAVNRMLQARGYRVVEAGHPRDALELLASGGPRVDLVLTDLVLPEMTGKELVARLRSARPGLPVLYMSGDAGGAMDHQGVIEPGTSFLQKPFTPDGLMHKVRVALDAERRRSLR
ncbi:MAG: response regulator [Archangiaceae bacterium]|nr:response regulator [Archangiaceae bacterium]